SPWPRPRARPRRAARLPCRLDAPRGSSLAGGFLFTLPQALGVLAGGLRRRPAFLLAFGRLLGRGAGPGALELVLAVELQAGEAFGLELDHVAVHERAQAAMVGAGREDVAGFHRVDRAHPLDTARDLVRHVVGVEVLLEGAVDPQLDLELLRVGDLVGG